MPSLTEDDLARAEGVPPTSGAVIEVGGRGTYQGTFLLVVGPGERAWFEFHGSSDDYGAHQVSGTYRLDAESLQRGQDSESWTTYAPASDYEWIFDNRGTFLIRDVAPTDTEESYLIHEFAHVANADGTLAVRLRGVGLDRLDGSNRRILPGEDVVVEIHGRATSSCRADGGGGVVLEDPTMVMNPYCREFFAP